MPQYVLTYFNLRGRAEPARLLFKAAGVDFEDRRITFEEWGQMKENMRKSGKAPFAQLPVLEVDGKVIAQSFAIGRFVANEVGLSPSTNVGKAQADMILDGCADFGEKLFKPRFEKDEAKKAELLEQAKVAIPVFLKCFEDILKTNGGGKGFFVEDKLTYADIVLFNLLNHAFAQGKLVVPEEIKAFPLILKNYEQVMETPNIKKWIEERPQSDI